MNIEHSAHGAKPDEEFFASQLSVAKRVLLSRVEIGRRLASGRLVPSRLSLSGMFFRKGDLDRIRNESISTISAQFSKLNVSEREKLVRAHAEAERLAAGRDHTTSLDRQRAEHFVKVGETIDRAEQLAAGMADVIGKLERAVRLDRSRPLPARRMLLSASAIDAGLGTILGATVLEIGVPAIGKTAFADDAGNVSSTPLQNGRQLQVWTDEKSADSLLAAAKAGGGTFKVRSDHSDALGARVGVASNLRRAGNFVIADLSILRSCKNRDLIFETAQRNPELIGLSIDFAPRFEVVGDRAMLRVAELNAVDIVDAGAVTPSGL